MRIVIYGLNFAPELTGTGKYTGEMAHWLAQRGHDVHVVTAPPYYPSWKIVPGYCGWRYQRTCGLAGKQTGAVWRCPIWVPAAPGGVKRLLHLASFALSSAPIIVSQIRCKPDLVLAVAPSLFLAPAALVLSRLTGAKAWLHVQDFEVDAAFDLGMLRLPHARRAFLAAESMLLRQFDMVSTISDRMVERLAMKGVPEAKRMRFANWADLEMVRPLEQPSSFRAELALRDDQVVVLYAGNIGEKQGLEILIEAARKTERDRQLVWVIAGNGSARPRLEQLSAGLSNLRWLPLQPLTRLNDLLNLADIHVLPQRADAADLVMPSKLTGMLASGRPVVATAAPETQVGQVVPGRGVLVPPTDGDALLKAVVELAKDSARRCALGTNARLYAERNLDRDVIMTSFEQRALALVAQVRSVVMEGR